MKWKLTALAWVALCNGCAGTNTAANAGIEGGPVQRDLAPPRDSVIARDFVIGKDICTPAQRSTAEVSVINDYGALKGTMEVPAGCGPFDAVLIIAGSGPTDRNGNNPTSGGPNCYKMVAEELAKAGILSLRYDKAGIGASAAAAPSDEGKLLFDMYVNDAVRWVTQLRQSPKVRKIIIVGHSEGALVGLLAAKQQKVEGYVSLAGAGRPIGVVLREQLAKNLTDAALLAQANDIITKLEAGQPVSNVPTALMSLFRPSVQPYLISWMKYDPAKELSLLTTTTAIIQGTTDIQVGVADAKLLAAAKPDALLVLIDGMNHVFKAATLDTASQSKAYTDPSLPVVPELVDQLKSFDGALK